MPLNPNHPTRIDETQNEIMLRRAVGNPLLRRPGEAFQPGEYRALHPTGGIDSAPGRPGLYGDSAAFAQQDLRQTTPALNQQGPQFQGHVANLQAQRRNQLLGSIPPPMPMQAYQPPPRNATPGQLAQWSAPRGIAQPQRPVAPAAPQGVAATAGAPKVPVDVENTLDDIFAPPRPPRGGVPLPTPTPAIPRPAVAMTPPAAPQAPLAVPRPPVAPPAPQAPASVATAAPPVDEYAAMEQRIMQAGQQAASAMRQKGWTAGAADYVAELAAKAPERMMAFQQAKQLQEQNKIAAEATALGPEGRRLNEQLGAGAIDLPRYQRSLGGLKAEQTLTGLVPDIQRRFQTDPATGMIMNPEGAMLGLMGSHPEFSNPQSQGSNALVNWLAAKMDPASYAELRNRQPAGSGQDLYNQQRIASILKGLPMPPVLPMDQAPAVAVPQQPLVAKQEPVIPGARVSPPAIGSGQFLGPLINSMSPGFDNLSRLFGRRYYGR